MVESYPKALSVHYNDVIMSAMASQITDVPTVCSVVCSSAPNRSFKRRSKKTSKLRVTGLCELWGESTDDQWIPPTKGQLCGKCFHLMTSPCIFPKRPKLHNITQNKWGLQLLITADISIVPFHNDFPLAVSSLNNANQLIHYAHQLTVAE